MQIHRLRLLAEKGLPQHLIEGGGTIFGRYIIESIEERQAEFLNQGKFQKQTFTLKLRQFDRAVGTGSLENPVVTQLNDFIKGLL
jgi:phage protein U